MQNMCPAHEFHDEITIYFDSVKKEKISVLHSSIYVTYLTFYVHMECADVRTNFF